MRKQYKLKTNFKFPGFISKIKNNFMEIAMELVSVKENAMLFCFKIRNYYVCPKRCKKVFQLSTPNPPLNCINNPI